MFFFHALYLKELHVSFTFAIWVMKVVFLVAFLVSSSIFSTNDFAFYDVFNKGIKTLRHFFLERYFPPPRSVY